MISEAPKPANRTGRRPERRTLRNHYASDRNPMPERRRQPKKNPCGKPLTAKPIAAHPVRISRRALRFSPRSSIFAENPIPRSMSFGHEIKSLLSGWKATAVLLTLTAGPPMAARHADRGPDQSDGGTGCRLPFVVVRPAVVAARGQFHADGPQNATGTPPADGASCCCTTDSP